MKTKGTFFFTILLMIGSITIDSCKKDDDCTERTWYEDVDGDGFGDPGSTRYSCTQPANFVSNSDDTDDGDADEYPNAVWQGAKITFTRGNYVDWTLEANQDRITDNVWITRGNKQSIFNIAKVDSDSSESCDIDDIGEKPEPTDTEWAFGTIAEGVRNLPFRPFLNIAGCDVNQFIVGKDLVLHLITDDIYIDIKFTSWTEGDGSSVTAGGGFSYERSTKK